MRIVISGGWGYRNLGDDAILDSMIKLLLNCYENCTIDVLTYDVADSAIHQNARVSLHPAVHARMDFNACEIRYPIVNKDYPLFKKIAYRLFDRLVDSQLWFDLCKQSGCFIQVEKIIQGADLFIMSGGGYFNEKWLSKTRSHLYELQLAQKHNVPFYILGPTIGSFSEQMTRQIGEIFSKAQKISVRDDSSYAEVKPFKDTISLIPDVALSTWLPEQVNYENKTIGIIFTNNDSRLQAKLVAALEILVKQQPDWQIKLFISRRWKYDFANAMKMQKQLLVKNIDAEVIFPASFRKLEEGLAACKLVISENLHGLILAARNLVPVIAINDYPVGSPNYKKFIAFLKQSDSQGCFINNESNIEAIGQILRISIDSSLDKENIFNRLRLQVRDANHSFFDR